MSVDEVTCPMYGRVIRLGMCLEAQDVVDGLITQPPEAEFFVTEAMGQVCRQCPKRENPTAEVNGKV